MRSQPGAGYKTETRTLEICKVSLLVETGALQTERVDNVVDLDSRVVEGLLSLFGRGIRTNVCGQLVNISRCNAQLRH